MGQLTRAELDQVSRFIDNKKLELISLALLPSRPPQGDINRAIVIRSKLKEIASCTSKEIRESKTNGIPVTEYKLGVNLSIAEAVNWGNMVAKLTSVKHRNIILRLAHGEFYTKLKLHRFNLINNGSCPRCGLIEDLSHKFLECDYVRRIWDCVNTYRDKLITGSYRTIDPLRALMGSHLEANLATLTLTAETILRITYLRDEQNYLLLPRTLVTNCIKTLARNETGELKQTFKNLLE